MGHLVKRGSDMYKALSCLLIFLPLTACASSMPEERKDYILSRSHGFIEITISDSIVPDVIQKYGEDKKSEKPYSCNVSIQSNSEPYFSQSVYPDGNEPPYKISSGFRFPIPTGTHHLILSYQGCRADEKGVSKSIYSSTDLTIQNNIVYELQFTDGQIMQVSEKLNDEITLKQILEAVQK